ncbi:MAG: hypothetical protein V1748_03675 [Actinomycetota bacterium]
MIPKARKTVKGGGRRGLRALMALAMVAACVGPVLLGSGAAQAAPTLTEFTTPTAGSQTAGITGGPDGNVWFTEYQTNKIGRATKDGTITEFNMPSGTGPAFITAAPDGNLWFTVFDTGQIGRCTTAGVMTMYPVPAGAGSQPRGITVGPDGAL